MINHKVELKNNNDEYAVNCFLEINTVVKQNYRFIDLLRFGMQINLAIGVDYTSSNGDPSSSTSLHFYQQ